MKRCQRCGNTKQEIEFSKNQDWCRACANQYQRNYFATHREKKRAYNAGRREVNNSQSKAYGATHREELRAYGKRYYAAHREEQKAYKKIYHQSHKPQINAKHAKRRASEGRQTLRGVSTKAIEVFYAEAERITQETGIRYSVDHIIPLAGEFVKGLHVPWNLQIIPLIDNVKKGNKLV
jgi:hypothetical protein